MTTTTAPLHHSREKRETFVLCTRCKKPTFEFDMRCADCTIAVTTPTDETPYYQFDLEKERVAVEAFRADPEAILREIMEALE